jgi:hypothetical protein
MKFNTNDEFDDFGTIEPGNHLAMITKAFPSISKNGNKMVCLRYTVMLGDGKGIHCRDWITLKRTAWGLGRLIALCKCIGVEGNDNIDDGLDPENASSVHHHLLGGILVLTTSTEPYTDAEGKVKQSVVVDGFSDAPDDIMMQYEQSPPNLPDDAFTDFSGESVGSEYTSESGETTFANDNDGFNEDDIPF